MRPSAPGSPVWLLDVDGVLNALATHLPTTAWTAEDWVQRVVWADVPDRGLATLPVLAARPVLEFIDRVYETALAEIRWHSTWRTAAITALAPALGLPPIPMSVSPEWAAEQPVWWKIPAARRVAASGRRLVWTDDQLELYRADPRNAAQLETLENSAGTLLLSVDPETGLTPDDLETISRFLE